MKFEFKKNKSSLSIGYRSPGLSDKLDPKGKMELCKELGMPVIEPQINPREFPDKDIVVQYRDAADDAKITIPSAGTFLAFSDPEVTSLDREMDETIEMAKILGVPYIFTLVQHPPEKVPHQEGWDLSKDRLKDYAQRVQDAGIILALEPEWFLGSYERVSRMIKEVDHPNFQKINFDATNFFTNGSSPKEILEVAGNKILNGHIKDGFYRTNQRGEAPVGKGEVPWVQIFDSLSQLDGHRNLFIEHCGKPEQVIAAAHAVTGFLEESGWIN